MGLLDRFKKRKVDNRVTKDEENDWYFLTASNGDEISLFGIEKLGTIKHTNNDRTELMLGRIIQQEKDKTLYMHSADFLGFELPEGLQISDAIMKAVMKEYEREYQGTKSNQRTLYIGRLINDRNSYMFGKKSQVVQNMLGPIVDVKRKELQAMLRNQNQEQRRILDEQSRKYREAVKASTDRFLKRKEKDREQRKQNPTLKEVDLGIPLTENGKRLENYDGVNINTGDILRLRRVNKIGKDGSETYLYSAYLTNVSNDEAIEYLGKNPNGYAVCFEMQKRLSDVVKNGNTDEIVQVLKLLSDERNFENDEKLTYAGEIDKNGQAIRRPESTSNAIRLKVQDMQRKFEIAMQQRREGEQR